MKLHTLLLILCFALCKNIYVYAQEKLGVVVSIPPQAFIVKEIGKDKVNVTIMVPPGAAAETYAPKPRQMTEISSAKIYLKIGFSFEDAFLAKIKNTCPDLRIYDMRHNISLLKMTNHAHGGTPCSCGNSPYDPHIWTSPLRMLEVAKTTYGILCNVLPEQKEYLTNNYNQLVKELTAAHEYIKAKIAPYKGQAFYIYHPGFGYFAEDYGLRQIALELNGNPPSAKQMVYFIEQAKKEKITSIFIQQQFASDSARSLAKKIGATVIQVENLSEDYITIAKETADKISEGLKTKENKE